MPCFFFNRVTGDETKRDHTGLELSGIDAARMQAVVYAGECLRDHPELIAAGEDLQIEIMDASGMSLSTIFIMSIDAPSTKHIPRTSQVRDQRA